ncbi:MAG: hypothetical protein DMG07_26890 [Acidobacteria bacterium]|nr:MAG: hypothetical protein DMG07_26890 [Acidobacteriota bacterium]
MVRKVGGRARAKHYPGLVKLWATNAARTRWNKVRAARGLPPLPLLSVPKIMTPRAIEMRERRELERRRRQYELDQAILRGECQLSVVNRARPRGSTA